jgi:hypothetical protein
MVSDSLSDIGIKDKKLEQKIKQKQNACTKRYGSIFQRVKTRKDINHITAEYLIKNIDVAYTVWKEKPWCRHVNFEQFCEYILPYRFYNEPLQQWRTPLYNELSAITDTITNKHDPKIVCKAINSYIANDFTFSTAFEGYPFPGVMDMWQFKTGTCIHRYFIVAAALRSIGVPVKIDMTPQWNDYPGSHSWLILLDTTGRNIPFNGGEPDIHFRDSNVVPIGSNNATTVYRKTYAKQKNVLSDKLEKSDIPRFFRSHNKYEVTTQYNYPQTDITIKLHTTPPEKISYTFLCCFGYSHNIVPFTYEKLESQSHVTFKDIGRFGIYFPGYYTNNSFTIASNPVHVPKHGDTLHYYEPETNNRHTITLYRKYPPKDKMVRFARSMLGAQFQAAHTADFKNPVTLHTIDSIPKYFVEKSIDLKSAFQYYRYKSDTGKIRVAELQFVFDKQYSPPHHQNIISNINQKKAQLKNAFDNNIRTNLNATGGSWIGITLSRPRKIKNVRYLPRNNFNIIEAGDTYRLLYFDFGWHTIATKKAHTNHISFKNVPKNAVLLLRNLTRGSQERIFVYEEGEQKWLCE